MLKRKRNENENAENGASKIKFEPIEMRNRSEYKSIYMKTLNPKISGERVSNYIKKYILDADNSNFYVKELVTKFKKTEFLYTSFKIIVTERDFPFVVNHKWPSGIFVRQFSNRFATNEEDSE